MDIEVHVGDLILASMFTALGWFVKVKLSGYDKKHEKHFDHATKAEIHQTSMSKETVEAHFQTLTQGQDHIVKAFDIHVADDKRAFEAVQIENQNIRRTVHWVGDCMVKIAAKMNVELPDRPS